MQANTHSSQRLVGDTRMLGQKQSTTYFLQAIIVDWISAFVLILGAPAPTGPYREIQATYTCQVVLQETNPKLQETESLMIGKEHIVLLSQRVTLPLFYGSVNQLLSSRALCYTNVIGKMSLLRRLEHRDTVPHRTSRNVRDSGELPPTTVSCIPSCSLTFSGLMSLN